MHRSHENFDAAGRRDGEQISKIVSSGSNKKAIVDQRFFSRPTQLIIECGLISGEWTRVWHLQERGDATFGTGTARRK